jgi:hypothetical protein
MQHRDEHPYDFMRDYEELKLRRELGLLDTRKSSGVWVRGVVGGVLLGLLPVWIVGAIALFF